MPCDEDTFEKVLREAGIDGETEAKLRGAFSRVTAGQKTTARGHGAPAPNMTHVTSF